MNVPAVMTPQQKTWYYKCRAALFAARCNPLVFPHVEGNTNAARYLAFDSVTSDYVAIVDPDDLVDPLLLRNAIQLVHEYKPSGLFTNEHQIDESGMILSPPKKIAEPLLRRHILERGPGYVHNLKIFNMDTVRKYRSMVLEEKYWVEWMLTFACSEDAIYFNQPVYNWRLHANNSHKLHQTNTTDQLRITQKFKLSDDSIKIVN